MGERTTTRHQVRNLLDRSLTQTIRIIEMSGVSGEKIKGKFHYTDKEVKQILSFSSTVKLRKKSSPKEPKVVIEIPHGFLTRSEMCQKLNVTLRVLIRRLNLLNIKGEKFEGNIKTFYYSPSQAKKVYNSFKIQNERIGTKEAVSILNGNGWPISEKALRGRLHRTGTLGGVKVGVKTGRAWRFDKKVVSSLVYRDHITEAAKKLGISKKGVYYLRRKGKLEKRLAEQEKGLEQ